MDAIRSFHGKLRSLAVTLDSETARLHRALKGEESDLEGHAMKTLCDLHSEIQTLKGDVDSLLHKVSLESQENTHFLKAAKVLMKRNSTDIMKIREFFQMYGYTPQAQENSVDEHEIINTKLELASSEDLEKPDMKGDALSGSVSEMSLRSPQLSDFGLERYFIPQVLPGHRQDVNNLKEEPVILTPPAKESLTKVLKTPKCALKMDDFECVTPKLEHFGISEYTYLNEDYTMGLTTVTGSKKSEEAIETEPVATDFVSPGPTGMQLERNDAVHSNSPLPPTFCTPGLKIPSTKNSTDLVPTDYLSSETVSSTINLEEKVCASLVLNPKESFENLPDPSSPTISSYEDLLSTPTPPEVTAIPEDILQILSRYNSNLATPVAVKGLPPRSVFLKKHERQNIQDVWNKEN
ncbi:PREDICTED: spindle and kinetochore-associated protein 3 [Elephantulus edwardii]|uniref:spindle and kinetochore-associated protein 3 n=1 Tax=Elephantulus edwardii TaxID=28737 RepID=UPI0003F0E64F|nr:PREDICTED: spindle and kinetochore-associated protein 3 [Elephantulus edwardii]